MEDQKTEISVETTPIVKSTENAALTDVLANEDKRSESLAVDSLDVSLPEVEVEVIDNRDKDAEALIKWGAARAGVIVITPFLGTVALIANEVYMISKIADIYGEKIARKSVLAFLGALGGTVFGNLVATLLPLPFVQMPIAISVTYGVGKAAQRWIKDGQPDNLKPYIAVFEVQKEEGQEVINEIQDNPNKDIPLGDEKKDFIEEFKQSIESFYPVKAHQLFNEFTENLVQAITHVREETVETVKKVGVTEEQINTAKFRAIAAREVAEETAQKATEEFKIAAKKNVKKLSEEAIMQAKFIKEQASLNLELMKAKAAALKAEAKVKETEARLRSEKAKHIALEQMQLAKQQAESVRQDVCKKSEEVAAKAAEVSDKIKNKATMAGETLKQTVEDFCDKVEERADLYQEIDSKKTKSQLKSSASKTDK